MKNKLEKYFLGAINYFDTYVLVWPNKNAFSFAYDNRIDVLFIINDNITRIRYNTCVNCFFLYFSKIVSKKNRFNNPDESAEIYENEPSGTVIKRLQARSTSSLLFELVEGDTYSLFAVNPSTGVLVTRRPLDYESCHVYNLSVTATNMVLYIGFKNVYLYLIILNGLINWLSNRFYLRVY